MRIADPSSPGSRPVSILRARRATDLYLAWSIGMNLCVQWRMLAEPIDTWEMLVDLARPGLSRRERTDLIEMVGEDDGSQPNPAWLTAGSRWFCQLELSTDTEECSPCLANQGQIRGRAFPDSAPRVA